MAQFTAATISFGGLVKALGTTSSNGINEKSTGIMFVQDSADLVKRTSIANASGPTGSWYEDWWSVWNYLQYGIGACIVGGTGSDGWTSISVTNTPLHATDNDFHVIFNSGANDIAIAKGTTSSARAAVSVATTRKDCFALVGNADNIPSTDVTAAYADWFNDFGITASGDWDQSGVTAGNIIFVGNQKKYIRNWNNTISGGSSIGEANLAADVAGCFGRAYLGYNEWTVPAGVIKGRILNSITLKTNYTNDNLAVFDDIRISPVITLPGRGSFFFGNTTAADPTKSNSNISFQGILNYLRKKLLDIALALTFEPNNASTRASFTAQSENVLSFIRDSGSISNFSVICDASNNPTESSNLVAQIIINPVDAIETVTLTVTNGNVNESFSL